VCVAYGVIEMLMSVAVVAIMILSACGVQIGHESRAGCMNEPKHFECTMSMLPSDMSCGEEIKVAAKSGTCSTSMFGRCFHYRRYQGRPFLYLNLALKRQPFSDTHRSDTHVAMLSLTDQRGMWRQYHGGATIYFYTCRELRMPGA